MSENADICCIVPDDLSKPGTHVLVIGVSRYLHGLDASAPSVLCSDLGIADLTSAARSAGRVADWLLHRADVAPLPPLASMRVLLSPIDGEFDTAGLDARLLAAPRATRANVEEATRQFRAVCEKRRDNHAIVYVAGHGIQIVKDGAVLLLEDFGDDNAPTKLHAAVDMISLYDGLCHADAPKQQCWFIDICRERPELAAEYVQLHVGIAYDERDGGSTESAPLFMATSNGMRSYARINGISLFCEALLWALERGGSATGASGAIDRWHVPFSALCEKLPKYVEEVARLNNLNQRVIPGGNLAPGVFHVYAAHPTVDLTVSLCPDEAPRTSNFEMQDDHFEVVYNCSSQWPVNTRLGAGLYSVHVTNTDPYPAFHRTIEVRPPEMTYAVVLQ